MQYVICTGNSHSKSFNNSHSCPLTRYKKYTNTNPDYTYYFECCLSALQKQRHRHIYQNNLFDIYIEMTGYFIITLTNVCFIIQLSVQYFHVRFAKQQKKRTSSIFLHNLMSALLFSNTVTKYHVHFDSLYHIYDCLSFIK